MEVIVFLGIIFVFIAFILYLIKNFETWYVDKEWSRIEKLNEDTGIKRDVCYIDPRGYLRWKGTNRLCHRDIAFNAGLRHHLYSFGRCDVHHIDHNKLNNQPQNLQVLSRQEHERIHGRY